ncbi:competence protein ComK [Jeotgalibacillus haloalkalitolerans]|uniref:Competence protein ComK n=1 Tax=Jeotgalibacillus haloalkalitolerans TaxID=3104292 RepID=A0ABU5KJC3_9BACL|nr:competence protein ComK [Jeotgalibacillus sp. HH7-29]MDZ5711318.1 competence protein ComK [Jeotgalibacillus sp. HH7-29]
MKENHLLINRNTLAIRKIEHPEFQSEIIHADGVQYAADSPMKILFDCCILAGSTLKGNIDASRHKLGVKDSIVPVILDPVTKLIVMPTHVPNDPENIWIFPEHVLETNVYTRKNSVIEFTGGKKLLVNLPLFELKRQLKRTERFRAMRRVQSFMIMKRDDK